MRKLLICPNVSANASRSLEQQAEELTSATITSHDQAPLSEVDRRPTKEDAHLCEEHTDESRANYTDP